MKTEKQIPYSEGKDTFWYLLGYGLYFFLMLGGIALVIRAIG